MVGRLWPEVMVMADVPCVSLHVARFSRAQKKGHCLLESFPCLSASVFFRSRQSFPFNDSLLFELGVAVF